MLFASVDIGSNAVRLLFSQVYEQGSQIIAAKSNLVRVPLRLGMDVFSKGEISKEKVSDLMDTLHAFDLLLGVYRPVKFTAAATAAMREASNGEAVLKHIEEESKWKIRIIDGIEEARIIAASLGVLAGQKFNVAMFVDIGGGSTEISLVKDGQLISSKSFKIGTVRFLKDKVKDSEWKAMKEYIEKKIKDKKNVLCIGSGGNINKITKMYGKQLEKRLPLENLEYAIMHLKQFSLDERIKIMGLRPDRADVILPAARIFQKILNWSGLNEAYVPKMGLSDGLVYDLYRKMREDVPDDKYILSYS